MASFSLESYVTVAERLQLFWEQYPGGAINTEVEVANDEVVRVRAEVYRKLDDFRPAATGTAEERRGDGFINRSSALENCESSAVGRALAILGFAVQRGIASREEIEQAQQAGKVLDRRAELKQDLRRATEAWCEIAGLEFESAAEAARAYMNQELCLDVPEGAQLTEEQWDQLDKALSSILAA